jgi:MoaA/NifB/PqqE/SkfB family radical SAM enzyme
MILENLYRKYFDKKIPLMVSFEVTKRCVNNCIHCYLPETHQKKIFEEELTFNEIEKILDELKELGTVFLNITGGEPVLRKDIEKIIKKAIKNNFYVKLFTSLNFDIGIFEKLYCVGLREIDVSLYGRKEVHNKVCRNDSFDKVLNNIKNLKKIGFKINIKTPLMNININEINYLYRFLKENDLNFVLDPIITPLNNGSDFTLKCTLSSQK